MTEFKLKRKEHRAMLDLIAETTDARILRRTYALLWLADGESVADIAERLSVSPRSVYNWLNRFLERTDSPLEERLSDAERSGRPVTVQGIIDPLIDVVIDIDPHALGYRSTAWTVPLLVQYLADQHKLNVSAPSVRLALARLELHWKRPRHRLALRPETWRQAKGG
jgi:transposase